MLRLAVLLLVAAPAVADFEEPRELVGSADGVTTLRIDAGSGSLVVNGSNDVDSIVVAARIVVEGRSGDKAKQLIEKRVKLSLDRKGDEARLLSRVGQGSLWSSGWNMRIDLDVTLPSYVALRIDDGSGSMRVTGVRAPVRIDDGSGSITVSDVGPLTVDDGSGSIDISDVNGDVDVRDGSGSLEIVGVAGSVRIDDGSGGIRVERVSGDLTVDEAGSGPVSFGDIEGRVELED
jgi:hypothetical protein